MATYTEGFKRKAVALLTELNKEGVVIIDGTEIKNVRQLCFHLGISSWSIYNWKETYYFIDNIPEVEIDDFDGLSASEIKDELSSIETNEDFFDDKDIEVSIQSPSENKVKFGIDFWMHVARNLGLKKYRQYKSIAQLKLAIGNELIKQSGLVDMNKASKKLKQNGDKL